MNALRKRLDALERHAAPALSRCYALVRYADESEADAVPVDGADVPTGRGVLRIIINKPGSRPRPVATV
ncbi:hypothetical protein DMC47_16170 [Nostoc sp. 3335mG]|nr:hypothetical protein DMC47_16170 [Nostoc sp. 3335mG]